MSSFMMYLGSHQRKSIFKVSIFKCLVVKRLVTPLADFIKPLMALIICRQL
uniref:Uncharacterized protein n=1 Tax=Rhizophora mucronata TaxID=61149 RepID=A0A2P2M9V1_RHIMU